MLARSVALFALLTGAAVEALRAAPSRAARLATTKLGAGFGTDTRKKKRKTRDPSSLSVDDGWVPLVDLEGPVAAGEPRAVGRSITGKPYLVRRLGGGGVRATACECGRCEYPLLKAVQETAEDGVEELVCDMCGAAFSLEDGQPRPSTATGNGLLAPLLRNKPQNALLVFPTVEVDKGAVFVNITPEGSDPA